MHKRIFSVAPMMDFTDRHCRFFLRLISKYSWLYTEMINVNAILHGDRDFLLKFNSQEHPVALQLGGNDVKKLAESAKIGQDYGYDEINLNVGCPSSHVTEGNFGVCLMKSPELIAECILAMKKNVFIPVTIKTRIGVDNEDSYEFLTNFVKINASAGCQTFIIHARKAWLKGLSPKENRTLPPLNYEKVYQLKKDFPDLEIIINGGIKTTYEIDEHLKHVDGVMQGREPIQNCYFLSEIDQRYYGSQQPIRSRLEILEEYREYIKSQLSVGVPLRFLIHPILGLFKGVKGGRLWRRYLSENISKSGANERIVFDLFPPS